MGGPRITRRRFVAGALAAPAVLRFGAVLRAPKLAADPFALGVASGCPAPDGFVLWTRLAPAGGMPPDPVEVGWELASDDAFANVVRRGSARAEAAWAHSLHVEVNGLEPHRPYWYRFRLGDAQSAAGRAQTTPAPGASVDRLRLACASCANYEAGYYAAYRHLADESPDVVLFLGDYIYEYLEKSRPTVRTHSGGKEAVTLADYRDRYAQYKTDRDLQAAHAAFPWIVTWDDHEVENNYAGGIDKEDPRNKAAIAERAAGYQAFYEHMPVRAQRPQGPDLKLYRSISYGGLATFFVLDTRQYRSPEVALCAEQEQTPSGYCPASIDPTRTMLGIDQRGWLLKGLSDSAAAWNFVAQSVRFAQQDSNPDPAKHIFDGVDNWMGYVVDRQLILDRFASTRNPVVLSGDSHVNFVYDLKRDFADPTSPTVGTELLGTSISSEGDPFIEQTQFTPPAKNPQLRFFDNHRGYVRCALERSRLTADFRAVSTVRKPTATISTTATFVVDDARPGARRV